FGDRMFGEAFSIFSRDPEFKTIYEQWASDFQPETEHHVPGAAATGESVRRVRARIQRRWGSAYADPHVSPAGRAVRQIPLALDRWRSRWQLGVTVAETSGEPSAYIGGTHAARPVAADELETELGVTFHRVREP